MRSILLNSEQHILKASETFWKDLHLHNDKVLGWKHNAYYKITSMCLKQNVSSINIHQRHDHQL